MTVRAESRPVPTGTARTWPLLLVLGGTMLLDAVEVSTMVIAAPRAGTGLHISSRDLPWTMAAFALGMGASMLLGTRAVARHGRRRVYLAALFGFAGCSLLAALAGDLGQLLVLRCAKGCAAAFTAPTGLAIIGSSIPAGPARDRAISVYTLCGASGFSVGLVLSGVLTEASWRWTQAVPAPVAGALLLLAIRVVPADRPAGRVRYGLLPTAALTIGVVSTLYGLTRLTGGIVRAGLGALLLGAGVLAGLLVLERRSPCPLVPVSVRRQHRLWSGALGAAVLNGSYLGQLFILTVRLQGERGWSPLRTAVALLPASLPLAISAPWSGRMVRRFGTGRLIALGTLPPATGYLLNLRLSPSDGYWSGVLPQLGLIATGFVLAFTALNLRATEQVAATDRLAATGLYQTMVQLGAVITLVAVGCCLPAGRPSATDWQQAYRLLAVVGLLGVAIAVPLMLTASTGRKPFRAAA
ncbi:MAG TPA: MFS transporter [Jatrophihabitans sp.]|nr:MFS transporter [Jatrophihabitans sp.]